MAKCAVCGKGQISGNKVSHSHVKTRRKWNANLQPVRVKKNETIKKQMICSRCLRSGKVEKANKNILQVGENINFDVAFLVSKTEKKFQLFLNEKKIFIVEKIEK